MDEYANRHREPTRPRWRAALALTAFLALAAASLGAACARWVWFGELLANLRWYLGLFGCATVLALAWIRRPWLACAAAVLALAHLAPSLLLWTQSPGAPAPSGGGERLVVVTANLAFFNRSAARVHAFLVDADADVVALQEVSPFWSEQIDQWRHLFPHQIVCLPDEPPPPDTFGIALLSRHPFATHRRGGEELGTPWIVADVEVFGDEGAPIRVVAAHPTRPGAAHRIARRDRQILGLVDAVAWDARTVLLADLNATRYSPIWSDLVERTGLRDARRGFGRLATWRASVGPLSAWLALDQILVGSAFAVEDCRIGPNLASDHRPLLATLRVARRAEPGAAR